MGERDEERAQGRPSGRPDEHRDEREPVVLVGRTADEHGVLREILCGAPHPLACRLCNGEADCPYVESRSRGRLKVRYTQPPSVVPVVVHRRVRTSMDTGVRPRPLLWAAAAAGWLVVAGLVLRYWVLEFPGLDALWGVAGLKLAVFAFAVVGVPLVRLGWSRHGGRFRPTGGVHQ